MEEHICRVLDLAFDPLIIRPDDPRHLEDLRALIVHGLRSKLAAGQGGAEGGAPRQAASDQELAAATQVLLEKSKGAFVYIARWV
jgi:hypothetical protein